MTLVIRDGTNVPKTITELQIRDGTNTPRDLTELRVRDSGNVSRVVFSTGAGLSVSADPTSVVGIDFGTGNAQTNPTTATPVGGTGPYTYAWTIFSFSGDVAPTIDTPTLATTVFIQTGLATGEYSNAVFRITVTDSLGATADALVSATFASEAP